MSSSVDDKIVAMKFDNVAFERNLQQTLASLDKLKQSLDFTNSTRGLTELSNAGKNVNLSPLADSVDGISLKFLALASVGIAAIANLTSRAIDAGFRIAKAFTFAPVMDGFTEFETNMKSIQTILANTDSKGTSLAQVTAALDQLNTYSDQTIYNFGEMTRNIGTFTAAGVGLDQSVAAIKGIANLAAISGSSAEQASVAMYQLSQAISTGSVKLMDWNSVVNAGLGGEVFQKALFETGKALGTLQNVPITQTFDEWKAAGNSFRNSLSETGSAVETAADKVAKASKAAAKEIANAQKSQSETAARGAESVQRAEESQVKAFDRATKDVSRAVESQRKTIESNAQNSQNAIDRVTAAQERLKKAMEPASIDEMQAATDGLTSAQLDQVDIAKTVAQAEREQTAATNALARARQSLANATTPQQRNDASRRVSAAEAKSLAVSEALTRARLQQNAATRGLHQAEKTLSEAKKKGTEEDQNVIDANQALIDANNEQIRVEEENTQRAIDASAAVAQAEIDAANTRKDAIKSVSDARKNAADNDSAAASRTADAIESAAQRIDDANKNAGGNRPGWLTDKVLLNTLQSFTGDLNEAQLLSLGYTKEQAAEMLRLGRIGKAAATEVKTFHQLISTVKESIGSGWSETFRNVIGDFNESKQLFTGINNVVSGMVSRSADARNKILSDWKQLGGRDVLIQGFKNALSDLGAIVGPIKDAFREIFPPTTGKRLFDLTQLFLHFTASLKASFEVSNNIKRTFAGLFAVLDIGWNIFKGIIGLIGSFISSLAPAGGGVLHFTGNVGDMLVALDNFLVKGGALNRFFSKLSDFVRLPGKAFNELKNVITGFLSAFPAFNNGLSVTDLLAGRLGSHLDSLKGSGERLITIWDRLGAVFDRVRGILDNVFGYLKVWFSELGKKLAAAIQPGDFNAAIDAINVGLLGGILLLLKKFVSGGLKLDLGNGLFAKVGKSLDALTGTLKAMQAQVKAQTLLKIAIAMGILAASVLVLSLINSEALTKAMTAMAVGFGQLVGTMAILNKIATGPKGALTLTLLVGAMIGLAGAMVIMAGAVRLLSSLKPQELATGLVGITVMLTTLTIATKFISANSGGMLLASVAMIAIASALVVLAGAVKLFSMMSWAEMAKGLVGVAAGLLIIIGAVNLVPIPQMLAAGVAMIPLATGIAILAGAVKIFASMSWAEIGKGMAALAGGLLIIAAAMNLMPPWLIIIGPGLLLVAVALNVMAGAIGIMGSMKFGTIAKGLGALAAMLVILAVGLTAMSGALPGAAALVVVAGALTILSVVLKVLASMSILDIVKSLAAIAAVLALLGGAALLLTPVIPVLFSLGAALALLGAAFALFGVGAILVAKSFELMARAGRTGVMVLIDVIKMLITALPGIATALVISLADAAGALIGAVPVLVRLMTALLLQLLETVITLTPKIAEAIVAIVFAGLKLIRENFPAVIETAVQLVLSFLRGIRDHIGEAVALGVDIVVNFITGIGNGALRIVTAAADMVINFLNGLAKVIKEKEADIILAGFNIAVAIGEGFLKGLEKIPILGSVIKLGEGAISAINKVFDSHSPSRVFIKIGQNVAKGFALGLDNDKEAENSAVAHAERIVSAFYKTINQNQSVIAGIGEINPVITPVLDLTKVAAGARNIDGLLSASSLSPDVSFAQARTISKTSELDNTSSNEPTPQVTNEVRFEQNNYSPTALSTKDIYRNTKSQIVLAKEELGI